MNARELMHFFELRCCNRAQAEIREVADLMLAEVQKVSPQIFRDAGAACVRGPCPEGELTCGKPRRRKAP
jgi:thymidylate synthase (FAD)